MKILLACLIKVEIKQQNQEFTGCYLWAFEEIRIMQVDDLSAMARLRSGLSHSAGLEFCGCYCFSQGLKVSCCLGSLLPCSSCSFTFIMALILLLLPVLSPLKILSLFQRHKILLLLSTFSRSLPSQWSLTRSFSGRDSLSLDRWDGKGEGSTCWPLALAKLVG